MNICLCVYIYIYNTHGVKYIRRTFVMYMLDSLYGASLFWGFTEILNWLTLQA